MSAFKITDQDLASLPDPIAIPARRYRDETDPRSKLLLMVDTIETVFKFGSAIAVRELLRASDLSNDNLPTIRADIMRKMGELPGLGDHVGFIRKICGVLPKSHQGPCIMALIKPLVDEKLENPLTAFRNNYKGHGAVPAVSLAETLMSEVADKFGELLKRAAAIHCHFPSCHALLGSAPGPLHLVLKDPDGSIYLDLYPLFLAEPSANEFSIIYNGRKKGTKIQYLNYQTGEGFVLHPGQAPADAFNSEFPPATKKPHELSISYGPASELIEVRSSSFKGRDADLAVVDQFIAGSTRQVLVVTGAPGQGKTSLLCKWLNDIATKGNPKQLVIRHFIVEGDVATCSTVGIFRSLCAQLRLFVGQRSEQKFDWKAADWQQEFCALIQQASQKVQSVVVVIDGLDEAERHRQNNLNEESILQWLPASSLLGANVLWILSIRPQYLHDPTFRAKYGEDKARHHALGQLDANAIRAILYDHASNWREVAIREDLVEIILEKSEGSPIYIHQLAGDLEEGRLEFSEAGIATIPQGMMAFHRRILEEIEHRVAHQPSSLDNVRLEAKKEVWTEQLEAGEINREQYEEKIAAADARIQRNKAAPAAQILGLLAVCLEPLSIELLAQLTGTNLLSIQATLEEARSVLTESTEPTGHGNSRYSLYHSSFREFFLQHRPEAAQWGKNRFKEFCSNHNYRTNGYVIRHGVLHLLGFVGTNPAEEAVRDVSNLLTDLDFITVKVRAGLVPELLQDYEEALTCLTGTPSSMFHGLEVDAEDRSWMLQNHLARRESRPLPFPDRGGDLVVSAIRDRLELEEALTVAEQAVRRLTNISEGRDPDYYPSWDFEDDSKDQAPEPPPSRDVPAGTAEALAVAVQERDAIIGQMQAKQQAHRANIFAQDSATARAVARIISPDSKGHSNSLIANIEAFRIFVEEMWMQISDDAFSISNLCLNFRNEGPVREAGLAKTSPQSTYMEALFRPNVDVRKTALPLKEYGVDDNAADICFFDGFQKCLRVLPSGWEGKDVVYAFEVIDVVRNRICCTTHLKPKAQSDITSDWRPLRVSEDGLYGRYRGCYFEIHSTIFSVGLVSSVQDLPELQALELRPAEPDHSRLADEKAARITSDDGALSLVTGRGKFLDLIGSFAARGITLLEHRLCGYSRQKLVNFSENGRLVFSRSEEFVKVVDLVSWTKIFELKAEGIRIAHSPDGRLLATDSNGEIKVWDVASGQLLRQFGCSGRESEMHFSRSGELLHVRGFVCDLRTGRVPEKGAMEKLGEDFHAGDSHQFGTSDRTVPDSGQPKVNCSLNDGTLPAMGLNGPKPMCLLVGSEVIVADNWEVVCASFAPKGVWERFSLECPDSEWPPRRERGEHKLLQPIEARDAGLILLPMGNGLLHIMDPKRRIVRLVNNDDYLAAMDVTVGEQMIERYIESSREREQRESSERWAEESGKTYSPEPKVPQFYINAAAISDDGEWILTATNWDAVRIWDASTGRCVRAFSLPRAGNHYAGHVEAISLTPDGMGCYLILLDGNIHLLDFWGREGSSWKLVSQLAGSVEVACPAVQNRRFAYLRRFAEDVHELHDLSSRSVLSLAPLRQLFGAMDHEEYHLLVTPDDRHLLVAFGKLIALFTLDGLRELTRFPVPAMVERISNMMPDGQFVLQTGAGEVLRLKLNLPET